MRDSLLRARARRLLGHLGLASGRRASLSCFDAAALTRGRRRGVDPRSLLFAAVDLETTGLEPGVDRVCEIGVVRFRADGQVLDEYVTLLDPQRPMDATAIHGIADEQVRGAPTFVEVAPELERLLAGTVVVAHNLAFEDAFLGAEFRRAGRPMPRWPGLCTLVTARAQLDGSGFGLAALHRSLAAAPIGAAHTALGDARATAAVLAALLAQSPAPLRYRGARPPAVAAAPTPALVPSSVRGSATRESATRESATGEPAARESAAGEHAVRPSAEESPAPQHAWRARERAPVWRRGPG